MQQILQRRETGREIELESNKIINRTENWTNGPKRNYKQGTEIEEMGALVDLYSGVLKNDRSARGMCSYY